MTSAIQLPQDQYAHIGAPTEWWWHTGTLNAADGRVFGFEINAASFTEILTQFTEMMVTDVSAQLHYQKTTIVPFKLDWAQAFPEFPWFVRLGGGIGANGAVQMQAPTGNIFPMSVVASFQDDLTSTPCAFNLLMTQSEAPLLVWGTGVHTVYPDKKLPIEKNNYYYSFTKLQAVGTLQIGSEIIPVSGLTWMDHEYGAFSPSQKWILQDMQLDNGVHISNFSVGVPVKDQQMDANATILWPDGNSTFVATKLTPQDPTTTSENGTTFCLTMLVEIAELDAVLTVTTPVADQTFSPGSLYEGVARVSGKFGGLPVGGTAWNEQSLSQGAKPGLAGWR
ncbi:MAG TPA: lipocalin-like domain-containing protein [Rhizomicrobium sp.]|nr:lipocalin-like domain-containing protein [Rhizomicrobium sp.]